MAGSTGFQPRNTPAERRAFFDVDRRLRELPSAADIAALDARLDALEAAPRPKVFTATGTAGVTSGATAVTPCTLNIPAQPVAGKVMVQAYGRIDKSVVGDAFSFNLYYGASIELASGWPLLNSSNVALVPLNGQFALAAGTAATVFTWLQRYTGGTGTATYYAAYGLNHIDALWVPT